ncbi:hypothetical protein BC833DRAFT_565877 [Globomyces pollinis-pini]|nr:hypothetical protein BC833DRAFT_565877 [Globomyces pollinis-pini]
MTVFVDFGIQNMNRITTTVTKTHSEWTLSPSQDMDTESSDNYSNDSDDFDFLSDEDIDQLLNNYQAKITRQMIDKGIIEKQVSALEMERSLASQRECELLQELKKIEQLLSLS